MSSKILAIDIQKKRVCSVLRLNGFKGGHVVESLVTPIDDSGEGDFFSSLQAILLNVMDTMGTSFDKCIIGIPADYFFFRTLSFPFNNRKKIEQIIDVELENYLPLASGNFKVDFSPLSGPNAANQVSTASIEIKHLERFNDVFSHCGLTPDMLTIGSGYASAVVLSQGMPSGETAVFVHMESELTAFYAFKNSGLFFIRASGVKSDEQQTKRIEFLLASCLAVTEMLEGSSEEVSKIFLTDVENAYGHVAEAVKEKTGLAVEYLDFSSVVANDRLDSFGGGGEEKKNENAFALGVCDARGIDVYNFHRKVSEFAVFFQDYKASFILSCCLIVFAMLVWAGGPLMKINAAQKKIVMLDNQIREVFQSTFPGVNNIVDPVQQMKTKLDAARKKGSVAFMNDHVLNIELLNQISSALPASQDIIFTRFVRTENSLMVTGSADQFKTVDMMKNSLHGIPFFREVEINSASMDKIMNRVKFSLKILF